MIRSVILVLASLVVGSVADVPMCCACSPGEDTGSPGSHDTVAFTSAGGKGCEFCCKQGADIGSGFNHWKGGNSLPGYYCPAPGVSVSCAPTPSIVTPSVASGKVSVPTKEIAPGVKMPVVSIGTWTSDGHSGEEAPKIVGGWLGQGGRGIDTALIYGDQAQVAKAVTDAGLSREDVFITTKIPGCGAAQMSIDRDLKDLNTSYIDLLLIHSHIGLSCSSTWKVLEDNVKNGKLKSIGISNFNAENIEDILKGATIKPAVNQIEYNVFAHDEDVIAACRKHNITVEAYSPLAPAYSGKSVLKEPTVAGIAKAHNVSAFQVALKWIVQRGDVLTVLSSNPVHQASDADLWSFTLADDEMTKLGGIAKSQTVIV